MGLFNRIIKGNNNDNKQEAIIKYEKDVAQSITTKLYFEALDVFTCGLGLYAVMCLAGYSKNKMNKNVSLMEIINLDGKKLGDKVKKEYGLDDCLDDYCFIATLNIVASSIANQRKQDGLSNADGLASLEVWKDARTIEEIEAVLGCSVLEHPKVKTNLFIHKWGVIEIVKIN